MGLALTAEGHPQKNASVNMPRVFKQACKTLFGLDDRTVKSLVARSAAMPRPRGMRPSLFQKRAFGSWGWSTLDRIPTAGRVAPATVHAQPRAAASDLRCRGQLHSDPALSALNAPVYIATDSRDPLRDRDLKVFFDTFPCAFVLGDFASSSNSGVGGEVAELTRLGKLRSSDDGLALANFMYPMLEAVIVAKVRPRVLSPTALPGSCADAGLIAGFRPRRDAAVDVQRLRGLDAASGLLLRGGSGPILSAPSLTTPAPASAPLHRIVHILPGQRKPVRRSEPSQREVD